MARDLQDQVLLITGASSGIGAATAVQAAAAGMHVVLAARRADKLDTVAEQVRGYGREALCIATDVSRDADVDAMVEQAMHRFGRIDVLFANAGYGFLCPQEALDDDAHRQIFEVNYFGTVRCIRQVLPLMKQQGRGHIVITSSIVARVGLPYYAHYAATKAAQDALATGFRLEVEPHGIDVSAVYPIGTRTEFFQTSAQIGGRDTISENTPDIFMQSADHVARRIVKCLRKPIPEVWPAKWSHIGSSLACLLPRLTRMGLRRHAHKDRSAAKEVAERAVARNRAAEST